MGARTNTNALKVLFLCYPQNDIIIWAAIAHFNALGISEHGIRDLSQPKIRPQIVRLRSLGNVDKYDT